jgi:hypothetical protein
MYPNLLWIKGFFVIVDTHKNESTCNMLSFVSSRLISMVGENIYLYKKVQKRKDV